MTRSARILRLAAPVLVATTVAAACSSSGSSSRAPGATAAPATAKVSGTLNGSGSTFQKAYQDEAIAEFTKDQSGATINYQGKGSGAGQTDLQGGQSDFAGSDVTVKDADVAKFKGGSLLYFPLISGPITVSFKLSGVSDLQLSATSLAKIFSRTVKTWNDPAIAADNPGAKLPGTPITVAHRSDASGTTANFTAFLQAAGGADWTLGSDKTVAWPTDTQAGNGNAGVAQVVKTTDGSIGYVDFSDAKAAGLVFAKVKNAAGKYVAASLEGASAAVKNATIKADLTFDPINAAGDSTYPITSPTYVITYAKYTDQGKVALLKAFLGFELGKTGQDLASKVDFAPLPADLAQKAVAQIDKITVG